MKHRFYAHITGLLLFASICWDCSSKNKQEGFIRPSDGSYTKTMLALGDSYTIGQSVSPGDRFPSQTKAILNSNGISMEDPTIIATTGWTTNNLAAAIAAASLHPPYDIVTLLIGVNDQYQRHDTTGYRERFAGLLRTAIDLAGSRRDHVVVLSIPDYSVTPFAMYSDTAFIRMQIDQFNVINKEVTLENLCKYIDITPSTREALIDPTLITGDGLHPSGKEYRKWAEMLAALVKQLM